MANKLTFLRTSTSPSMMLVTFGTRISSLMVFSGDTTGAWTSFSNLLTGNASVFVSNWKQLFKVKMLFSKLTYLPIFNRFKNLQNHYVTMKYGDTQIVRLQMRPITNTGQLHSSVTISIRTADIH